MLQSLRRRLEGQQDGFTLIELMVVVLIIAILIAIAIPTFLGARQRAQDRAAQSVLRNALTAEKTHYADSQTYTVDLAKLEELEPSLTWRGWCGDVCGVDGSKNEVEVWAYVGPDLVILANTSASGQTFTLVSMERTFGSSPAGVYYQRGPANPGWGDPVACNCGWKTTGW